MIAAIAVLIGVGIYADGFYLLHQGSTGQQVVVTITDCQHIDGLHGGSTVCNGSWIAGGSLLANGHVVLGEAHGVGPGDVGKRIRMRAHGGAAYTQSRRTPYLLFGLGWLPFVAAGWFIWADPGRRGHRASARDAAAAAPTST